MPVFNSAIVKSGMDHYNSGRGNIDNRDCMR